MKIRVDLMSVGETAFALRKFLGPGRQWADFLADLARATPKNVQVEGFQLFPAAARHDRCRRPMYRPSDVREFVQNVWAANPSMKQDWSHVEKQPVEIDDSPILPWHMKKAEPVERLAATALA